MNKTAENECIEAVRQGFILTPEMENLFRLVWNNGYKQCQIDQLETKNDL